MITINLLPFEKHPLNRYSKKFILFFLLVVSLLTASTLICRSKINKLSDTIANIKKDIISYNKAIEEINDIKKKRKDIIKKADIIKNLSSDRLTVLNLLNFISDNIIAQKMWLTNLRINKDAVSLQGIVIDDKTAADFMKKLETDVYFSTVHLKKLKLVNFDSELRLKNFEIYCSIKKNGKEKN